jgi:tRNA (cmo5U34)-methyltransferase
MPVEIGCERSSTRRSGTVVSDRPVRTPAQGWWCALTVPGVGSQWHFDPDTYVAIVRSEVRDYDELQAFVADATETIDVTRVLDLGSGTGITARAVIDRHPHAELIGVDASDEMLSHARQLVPDATFVAGRLEDPLPEGPFDVITSALAIHHLDGDGKAALFRRIATSLRIGGRFVVCDVVLPESPVDDPIPLEDGIDQPSTLHDQLDWLRAAGLMPTVLCNRGDRVVVAADRPAEHSCP